MSREKQNTGRCLKRRLGANLRSECDERTRVTDARTETTLRRRSSTYSAAQVAIIVIIALFSLNIALAANDPGHDSLYVLKIGDSSVTGSINITGNLNASFVKFTSKAFGSVLDIVGNGTDLGASPSVPRIMGVTGNALYIDGPSNMYLNRYGGTSALVQVGDPGGSNALNFNVSGTIYQRNVAVCLANGSNCLTGTNTGNISTISAGNGISVTNPNGPTTTVAVNQGSGLTIVNTQLTIDNATVCRSSGAGCPGAAVGTGWINTTNQVYLSNNATNLSVGYESSRPLFFVDNINYRVGINTSTPAQTFNVNGSANITGQVYLQNSVCSAGQFLQTSAAGLVSCQTPSAQTFAAANNAGWLNTTTQVYLANNGTNISAGSNNGMPTLFIDTENGRISINTTSAPYALNVNGSANISDQFYLRNSMCPNGQFLTSNPNTGLVNCAAPTPGGNASGGGTTNTITKWVNPATGLLGNSIIYDDGTNVGIGTTAPQNKLAVAGTGNITGATYLGNSKCPANQFLTADTNTGLVSCAAASVTSAPANNAGWLNTTTQVYLANNATNVSVDNGNLFVDNTNNRVGIGITTPTQKLDVTGNASISDNVIMPNGVRISYDGTAYTPNLQGIAIGENSIGDRNSIALGGATTTSGTRFSVALGYGAATTSDYQFAIGSASYPMNTVTWGSVGINNTAATYMLDVNGQVRINMTATNGLIVGTPASVNGDMGLIHAQSTTKAPLTLAYSSGANGLTGATFSIDSNGNLTIDTRACTGACVARSTTLGSSGGAVATGGTLFVTGAVTFNNAALSTPNNLNIDSNTLYVDAAGNKIGINTSNPRATLQVNGSVRIGNGTGSPGNATGNGDLWVASNIEYEGNLYGPGADVAEMINSTGKLEAGDVVVADHTKTETIKQATKPYDTAVLGIVSTDPSYIMSKRHGDTMLALNGRVPIKASAENGAIKPGDLLTTSATPGYAMKCASRQECQGAIVGKSLGTLNEGTGKITAMVMLG